MSKNEYRMSWYSVSVSKTSIPEAMTDAVLKPSSYIL